MTGFQKYLVGNGWTRFRKEFRPYREIVDYSMTLSSYGPVLYFFSHPEHGEINWGLQVKDLPPAWCFDQERKLDGKSNEELLSKALTWLDEVKKGCLC